MSRTRRIPNWKQKSQLSLEIRTTLWPSWSSLDFSTLFSKWSVFWFTKKGVPTFLQNIWGKPQIIPSPHSSSFSEHPFFSSGGTASTTSDLLNLATARLLGSCWSNLSGSRFKKDKFSEYVLTCQMERQPNCARWKKKMYNICLSEIYNGTGPNWTLSYLPYNFISTLSSVVVSVEFCDCSSWYSNSSAWRIS